ncbi:MAG: hypothetical protein KF791_12785 [Verrucomicrobiae bacterium]|nr:hypothetical protein [Verrucomicrobiae bacterium]
MSFRGHPLPVLAAAATLTLRAATIPAVEVGTEVQFSPDITLTQTTASWFEQAGPLQSP